MKKIKISVTMLVLATFLLLSVSHAFADSDVTPDGKRDIPSIFSHYEVL